MQAFIFDMDGVIIDSEPVHIRAKKDAFAHFGVPISADAFDAFAGQPAIAMFRTVLERQGRTDVRPEDLAAYKHARYQELFAAGEVEAVPGSLAFIASLRRAGIPLALATSSHWQAIRATQAKFHLEDAFAAIVAGEDLPKSKPDPTIYRMAAEKLGVPAADCVVLEDANAGVRAAKGAGMHCIAYRNPHSGRQDLSMADLVIDRISDLRVEDIERRF